MRRKRFGRRWVAGLLALALVPSFAPDAFGLTCAHHPGGHGSHELGGESAELAPGPIRHGGHGAMHHGPANEGTPAPSGPTADHGAEGSEPLQVPAPPCTCAGACTLSDASSLAAAARPDLPSPAETAMRTIPITGSRADVVRPRFILPPATAPPVI